MIIFSKLQNCTNSHLWTATYHPILYQNPVFYPHSSEEQGQKRNQTTLSHINNRKDKERCKMKNGNFSLFSEKMTSGHTWCVIIVYFTACVIDELDSSSSIHQTVITDLSPEGFLTRSSHVHHLWLLVINGLIYFYCSKFHTSSMNRNKTGDLRTYPDTHGVKG